MSEQPEKLTSEDALDFTMALRRRMVDHLAGEKLPDDPKDRETMLKLLDGMDRQALGKMRIGVMEADAGANKLVSEALANLLTNPALAGRNPFHGNVAATQTAPAIPQLPADRPPVQTVEGETEVGVSQESFSNFMDKNRDKVER